MSIYLWSHEYMLIDKLGFTFVKCITFRPWEMCITPLYYYALVSEHFLVATAAITRSKSEQDM